jgi:hypothetical protein
MKVNRMSKLIKCLLGIGLILIVSCSSALGQEPGTLNPVTVTASSNVNQAVTRSFDKYFKNAVSTQWYKANRKYLVEFMINDQQNKALFRKNGALVYHLTFASENDMPDDVRSTVKSNYGDYTILNAIKVDVDSRDIWLVNMESSKKLALVRVEDGQLDEINDYDKQP